MTATSSNLSMPRRPLGKTGLEVSPIALAALSMASYFSSGASATGRLSAEDVEKAYHELGINTFLISSRMPELIEGVRRLIQAGHRDKLVLLSLVTFPFGWAVQKHWKATTQALGTDTLDVLMLGWVQSKWYVTGKTWPTLERLKAEGKIKAHGFSCHDRPMATKIGRELNADVLMIRYNAAHRGAEREIFPTFDDAWQPGFIAYTATRWGKLLSPLPEQGFAEGLSGPDCYRFTITNPGVSTVLCAPSSWAELKQNAEGACQGPLNDQRLQEVKRFGDAVHAASKGGQKWMFR